MRTHGKGAKAYPYRGFESHPLRHTKFIAHFPLKTAYLTFGSKFGTIIPGSGGVKMSTLAVQQPQASVYIRLKEAGKWKYQRVETGKGHKTGHLTGPFFSR